MGDNLLLSVEIHTALGVFQKLIMRLKRIKVVFGKLPKMCPLLEKNISLLQKAGLLLTLKKPFFVPSHIIPTIIIRVMIISWQRDERRGNFYPAKPKLIVRDLGEYTGLGPIKLSADVIASFMDAHSFTSLENHLADL